MEIEFLTHDYCLKHDIHHHPESPERLKSIISWIKKKKYSLITQFETANKEDILAVHTSDFYRLVELTEHEGMQFDFAPTIADRNTFKASLYAAGAGVCALENCSLQKTFFAAIRPPGHHSSRHRPRGFCFFNTAALIAELAIRRGTKRVAIVDFDQHYGDGTAEIFADRSDILYISSHADPHYAYPGSGFLYEIGRNEGKGFKVPIPIPPRTKDPDVIMLYEEIAAPIVKQFDPELLVVSAGFDGYENDPLGILGFSENCFAYFGDFIARLSSELDVPVLTTLEGGYSVSMLPRLLTAYISGFDPKLGMYKPIKNSESSKRAKMLLDNIKTVHTPYWELD